MESTNGVGLCPICHNLHLLAVHGDTIDGHDVSQVRDRGHTKIALGAIEAELVTTQCVKDDVDMSQVLRSSVTID